MNWTERRPNGITRTLARNPYGASFFFAVFIAAWAAAMIHLGKSSGSSVLIWAAIVFVVIFGSSSWYWGFSGRGEKWQERYDDAHNERRL